MSPANWKPLVPCNHLEPLRAQSKESTFPPRLSKEIQPVPFIFSLYQFPCRIFPIHAGEDWLQLQLHLLDLVEIETVELIVQQLHGVAFPVHIIHAEVDAPFGAVLDQLEKRVVFPGPVAQLFKRPACISFPLKQRSMVQYGPGSLSLLK